jgi:hypothetical protein
MPFWRSLELGDSWKSEGHLYTPGFPLLHVLISGARSGEVELVELRTHAERIQLGDAVPGRPDSGGGGLSH